MDFENFLEKYKLQIGIGLMGLILMGVGVFLFRQLEEKPTIEILSEDKTVEGTTIFVDIQGAVQNSGIYELASDARINDLLIRAGGLSAAADREWLAKNINLAQKLSDGAKIYIPTQKEVGHFGGPALSTGGQVAGVSGSVAGQININIATATQLETLWGIGEKRATDIIANRPYQSIEELKTKAKIPKNVFETIKEKITVY